MKRIILSSIAVLQFLLMGMNSLDKQECNRLVITDKVQSLKDTLISMIDNADNELFINHCKSFIYIIDSRNILTASDSSFLSSTYDAFCNNSDVGNARKISSYLTRKRSFVISWQSPTDEAKSFSLLTLPKDWNPDKKYPVYIQLHGLWNVANSPIEYMTYYFRNGASSSFAFEDGYLLSPWGRGNYWYQGISEKDIWECKAELERLVLIEPTRQYISGHSMGGYGAWYIASRSSKTWAGLGIYAGALWYGNEELLKNEVIQSLKNIPTYFVCGTQDQLLDVDQRACNLLNAAGNNNTAFTTFVGGHDYVQTNVENMYLWLKEFVNEDYTNIATQMKSATKLASCYPNPFRASTKINFRLENKSHVLLTVYNCDGKLIETIVNKVLLEGVQKVSFSSEGLSPGVYYCRIKWGNNIEQFKMVIMK